MAAECIYCTSYSSDTNECLWGGPGNCVHDVSSLDESLLDKFSDFESDDFI